MRLPCTAYIRVMPTSTPYVALVCPGLDLWFSLAPEGTNRWQHYVSFVANAYEVHHSMCMPTTPLGTLHSPFATLPNFLPSLPGPGPMLPSSPFCNLNFACPSLAQPRRAPRRCHAARFKRRTGSACVASRNHCPPALRCSSHAVLGPPDRRRVWPHTHTRTSSLC